MKIEIKQKAITWRDIRDRYVTLESVSGLKGINLLAAYNHNLKLLKELYEASGFNAQYPEPPKYAEYKQERISEFKKLATVGGVEKTKVVQMGNTKQEVLDLDLTSPEAKELTRKLEKKYQDVIQEHKKQEEQWHKDLDEPVPDDYLPKFWKAPFSDAPEDQEAFMAVEWFLKDVPELI